MQPRHWSKCRTIVSSIGAPSRCCSMRWMRPRGESISSPQSRYVGQVGRQNPQCTQSATRSRSGPAVESDATDEPLWVEPARGVELLLDPAHDVEPADRPPDVNPLFD